MYFDALSNSLLIANYNSQTVVRWVLGASSWTLITGGLNGLTGSTPILLSTPVGITLDPMGNLYVADSRNHRIKFFMVGQSSGKTIAGVSTRFYILLIGQYLIANSICMLLIQSTIAYKNFYVINKKKEERNRL